MFSNDFLSGSVKKRLYTDDADFNERYEGDVSPGLCKFSKKKRIKEMQRLKLKKTYSEDVEKVKTMVAKTVQEKRIASNIEVEASYELESIDFHTQDVNFDILQQQIEQDQEAAHVGFSARLTCMRISVCVSLCLFVVHFVCVGLLMVYGSCVCVCMVGLVHMCQINQTICLQL